MQRWQQIALFIWIGLFGLLVSGCEETGSPPRQVSVTTPVVGGGNDVGQQQVPETGIQLIRVQGTAQVQRSGSAERIAATNNAILYANDAIQLAEGASVAVRCLDGSTWYIPQPAYVISASGDCPPARNDLNMIVIRQGQVQLRYRGAGDFYPIADGTLARRGDEMIVDGSADMHILCGTGLEWHNVPRGQAIDVAGGCPLGDCVLCRQIADHGVPRAGLDPNIPYIITPRATSLLTQTPLLRWNPVAGANEYTVSIEGKDFNWQVTTSEPTLRYEGTPPLEAGEVYLLRVVADNGRASDEEGTARLGFVMLDATQAAAIEAELAAINALDLTTDSAALYQAIVYAEHNLIAEAITLLAASERPPAGQRLLGDLYFQIGLPLEAESAYVVGLGQEADPFTQAALQMGVGKVHATLRRDPEAIAAFKQAQSLYEISEAFDLASVAEESWQALEQ